MDKKKKFIAEYQKLCKKHGFFLDSSDMLWIESQKDNPEFLGELKESILLLRSLGENEEEKEPEGFEII